MDRQQAATGIARQQRRACVRLLTAELARSGTSSSVRLYAALLGRQMCESYPDDVADLADRLEPFVGEVRPRRVYFEDGMMVEDDD